MNLLLSPDQVAADLTRLIDKQAIELPEDERKEFLERVADWLHEINGFPKEPK